MKTTQIIPQYLYVLFNIYLELWETIVIIVDSVLVQWLNVKPS